MCQVHLDQEQLVSGSLNFAAFVGRSSNFFDIAPKIVVFDFVAVGAFDVIDDDDTNDDISDVVAVAVGLNLLLVLVVLL